MEEETLKQTELEWNTSIELNDIITMEKFMHDEWIIFSGDGKMTTKQMFLQSVKNGDLVHTKMDFKILSAKIFGDTGIIIQRGTSAGKWQGKDFSFYEVASSVYIKKNNKWKAVQTMIAPATS
jgi:ketosteroid isomerase-like protein